MEIHGSAANSHAWSCRYFKRGSCERVFFLFCFQHNVHECVYRFGGRRGVGGGGGRMFGYERIHMCSLQFLSRNNLQTVCYFSNDLCVKCCVRWLRFSFFSIGHDLYECVYWCVYTESFAVNWSMGVHFFFWTECRQYLYLVTVTMLCLQNLFW